MTKTTTLRLAALAGGALLLAGWFAKDLPMVRGWLHALPAGATEAVGGPALKTPEEAGLHKCRTGSHVVYSDQPCPEGSREDAIRGAAVTVVTMPKAPASSASASATAGGGASAPVLVKGYDKETQERLRDQAVENALRR